MNVSSDSLQISSCFCKIKFFKQIIVAIEFNLLKILIIKLKKFGIAFVSAPPPPHRIEVWSNINVRIAVNSGDKNSPHRFAMNAVNFLRFAIFSGEIFIFTAFTGFLTKKKLPYTGLNLWFPACQQLRIPLRNLSLPSSTFFVNLNQIQ